MYLYLLCKTRGDAKSLGTQVPASNPGLAKPRFSLEGSLQSYLGHLYEGALRS